MFPFSIIIGWCRYGCQPSTSEWSSKHEFAERKTLCYGRVKKGTFATPHLFALFQPSINMRSGEVIGFEGLIRSTSDSVLLSPTNMFKVAEEGRLPDKIEQMCGCLFLDRVSGLKLSEKLFHNVSLETLRHAGTANDARLEVIKTDRNSPGSRHHKTD